MDNPSAVLIFIHHRATTYGYDSAGHLITVTDPSGRTTNNTYDTTGRITGTSYSDGTTPSESFTYTPTGLRATTTDGTGTSTSEYDPLGRLTKHTNGNAEETEYAYNLTGHLTDLTYPNGQNVERTYDDAGRLVGITDWLGNTTTIAPDEDGNAATTTYGNDVVATVVHDAAGRTKSITDRGPGGATLASFTYTRNHAGDLASTTTTGISQPVENYGYTYGGRLESVNAGTYTYDSSGNPTKLANGATMAYDAGSQPNSYTLANTNNPITHDNQGNRLTGPGMTADTHAWDQANRLTAADDVTYTYDAAGLRSTRSPATGPARHYAWDVRAEVPLMLTDGDNSYLYDDAGNPVEHIDTAGTALFYQHDQYGSTRLLTDEAGAVAATFKYDAYGNLNGKTGTADTTLRWNGQAQDADTGLYYLRARWYDPTTAQFLGVDPLAARTMQNYAYGDGDPLNMADPTGRVSIGLCVTASAGFIGGGYAQDYFQVAFDDLTDFISIGFSGTSGGGVYTPSASFAITPQITSARTINQLAGPFAYGGLSIAAGAKAGFDVFGGKSCGAPNDVVFGGEIGVGLGVAPLIPAEVHGGMSNTWTHTLSAFNPWK